MLTFDYVSNLARAADLVTLREVLNRDNYGQFQRKFDETILVNLVLHMFFSKTSVSVYAEVVRYLFECGASVSELAMFDGNIQDPLNILRDVRELQGAIERSI